MRRIYQQATIVFSWLGESDEESIRAVKLVRHLRNAWNNRVGTEYDGTRKEMDLKGIDGLDDLWQELSVGIHSLNALFMRSYWQRVWIMQETMLAKQMVCICGSDVFSAEQIAAASTVVFLAVRTTGRFTIETYFFLSRCSMLRVHGRISTKPSSMKTAALFSFARSFRATDPRDYIYGLLGLIGLDIRPDYSLSVRAVYCSFARSWITQTSRLDILKFAGTALTFEEDRTDGLPTWVPDWHALSKCYQEPSSSKFNASAEMLAEARISTDLSRLWLNGMRCDEITSIVPHMGTTGNNLRNLSEYYWSVVNPDGANAYSQSMTRVEAAFWLLFQDEHEVLKSNLVKLRRFVFIYCSIMSEVNDIERLVAQLPHHESDSKIEEFRKDTGGNTTHLKTILGLCMQFGKSIFDNLEAVSTFMDEMRNEGFDMNTDVDGMELFANSNLRTTEMVAFHTSKGRIGLIRHCLANNSSDDGEAAAETRPSNVILPGDVICVLAGHDYPVVLRRQGYYFFLIGVCSVIGLMDGEIIELMRAGDAECKLLEIR